MINPFHVVTQQRQVIIHGIPVVDIVAVFSVGGLIIGWIYSSLSRKESARANTLGALPIVTFEFGKDDELILYNIGSSAATNVRVDTFYNPIYDDILTKKSAIQVLKFKSMAILMPNKKRAIVSEIKNPGLFGKKMVQYSMHQPKIKLKFSVRYQDITGKKYVTRVQIHDGQSEIIKAPTNFSLTQRLLYVTRWLKEKYAVNVVARYNLNRIEKNQNSNK